MNTEKLNALKERAYKTAVEHGFHEEEKPDAYYLGLVMSEMGEAINADQKGLRANVVRFVEDTELGNPFKESFETYIKDSLEDELSDIVIRLLDFAGLKGYELHLNTITQSDIEFLGLGEGFVADLFNLVGGLCLPKAVNKQKNDMTLNNYSILVARNGEEWVRWMFPRSVKDLERRLKKEDGYGT